MFAAVKRLAARGRAFFSVREHDRDFEEEVASHVAMLADDNVRRGMTPEQARRAAVIRLGGLGSIAQQHREARGLPAVEAIARDVRFAVRVITKDRWSSATAIATLAIGIGASSAIFTVMNAVMLRMMPVGEPHRLVQVNRIGPGGAGPWVSYPTYRRLRESGGFEDMLTTSGISRWTVVIDSEPERAAVELISPNYFSVLRMSAALGRLTAEPDEAVISSGYWSRRFGKDPAIIGKAVSVNGAAVTIAGVAPPRFPGVRAGESAEIWLSLLMQSQVMGGRNLLDDAGHNWLRVLGRLGPEASRAQATHSANVMFRSSLVERAGGMATASRDNFLAERIELAEGGFGLSTLRERYALPLRILLGASGLALLITCANLAHLCLVRAQRRRKEIALRLALGAQRRHIARQLLIESVLIAVIGGGLGVFVAAWGSDALTRLALVDARPDALALQLDWRVVAFTTAVALATGLLFGLGPAIQSARTSLTEVLKAGAPHHRSWPGRALAISQVTFALALVSGAGSFARSLWNLQSLDPGFDSAHVVLARIDTRGLPDRSAAARTLRELKERLETIPGVHSASLSSHAFFSGGEVQRNISVRGYVPPRGADLNPFVIAVSEGFFDTMGVHLIAGRSLTRRDQDPESTQVAVVNQRFARYYFGTASPVGKTFGFGDESTSSSVEIVGVVGDTRDGHLRDDVRHIVYIPFPAADAPVEATLTVRAASDPDAVMASIRAAVRDTHRSVAIVSLRTMREQIDRSLNRERTIATISGFFAILALLLACLGIYGVLAYRVASRTKEFAVRMAVGASTSDVRRLVAHETAVILALGLLAGAILAITTGRLAAGLLFGLSSYDAATLVGAAVAIVATGAMATWRPTKGAVRANPASVLRMD